MRVNRSYLAVACFVVAALCVVNFVALTGYFKAVEGGESGASSEKRFLSQLQGLHGQLKTLEDPEQAKRLIRSFETGVFSTANSDAVEEFRKAFAPVVSAFASKPKESDHRFLLVRKRELMEGLVNAYRREIPNGPIPVRAAYLNILFDTQNSLLNEGDETEQVYLRRTKERFAGLKNLTGANQALAQRVEALESVFQAYERGFESGVKWRAGMAQASASAEKALPKVAKDFQGSSGERAEDARRFFLYSCVLALIAAITAFAVLFLTHKVLKVRSESKADSFLRIFKEFGREKSDPAQEKELNALKEDPDWAELANGATAAEAEFLENYEALLAVPSSLACPYFVVGKDRVAKHWNKEAIALLGLESARSIALDDIVSEKKIQSREGDTSVLIRLLRNSFSVPKADVHELKVSLGDEWHAYELLLFPIVSGSLVGGKLLVFREIRNEAIRLEQAVTSQLTSVKECVHKISHGYSIEGLSLEGAVPEVKAALADLGNMKSRIDEREMLWKSETGALLDQVNRQKEILLRLSEEALRIREAHSRALELVGKIHGGDEDWLDEVCVLERELEQWKGLRNKLHLGLNQHGVVMEKARSYESEIRRAAFELSEFLSGYEAVLQDLNSFSEEARVHAVNMSFVKDPAQREFAARSRAYAAEIGRFTSQAGRLGERVRSFLSGHPATDLASHLESEDVDPEILKSLMDEDSRLETYLKRWKASGEGLVSGGQQALGILREADKKGAVLTQLGETSLIIIEQAKGNLERWN